MSVDFWNISLDDAKQLLRLLLEDEDMRRKLWKRWATLFSNKLNDKHVLRVEYHPALSIDDIRWYVESLYRTIFQFEWSLENIDFRENTQLQWGMKVFLDDNLLDLSYKRIEKKLQK